MKQKYVVILATAITAFILVAVGAIIGQAAQSQSVTLTPEVTEVQDLYAQREAEYQARLAEANLALEEAYARLEAVSVENTPTPTAAVETVQASLSPQDAMLIASILLPNGKIQRIPELVDYQGTVAYEVVLANGLLYIDANTGRVLYNSFSQPQVSVQTRGSHEDDDEHEGHEDNDD